MKNNKTILAILVLALVVDLIYIILSYVGIKNKPIRIEAASAFYPFTTELVEIIYDENYSRDLTKLVSTTKAYEDILSNKADIIVATKPSEEQEEMIKNSNINLKFETIYLEPLAILVNKENNIENVSIDEIHDIYFGNDLNWNTYQLEKNNGSQTCFESIVKDNKLGNNHFEIDTMNKIVDRIAKDKNGIGYAFYSYCFKMYTNDNIKVVRVNDKDIKDKDYPLLFEVYLIYREDNNNKNVSRIVNWIKTEEGQKVINNIK